MAYPKVKYSNGKYGYVNKDGSWFAEPEFDEAYEFEDGRAVVVKEGYEGWISLDPEEGDYCPWSQQERWLREYKRKRERRNKILRLFGLGPKPMDLWDDSMHSWLPNKLHHMKRGFLDNPVPLVTIIFGSAVLIYTFFVE